MSDEPASQCGTGRPRYGFNAVSEKPCPDVERMRNALEYLADPESWSGDPHNQESCLYGHYTPFELATAVLTARKT
jgi:hypothetical protein